MNQAQRKASREAADRAKIDREYPPSRLDMAAGAAARFRLYTGYEKLNILPSEGP